MASNWRASQANQQNAGCILHVLGFERKACTKNGTEATVALHLSTDKKQPTTHKPAMQQLLWPNIDHGLTSQS